MSGFQIAADLRRALAMAGLWAPFTGARKGDVAVLDRHLRHLVADPLKIGFDHLLDYLFERDGGPPPELRSGL